VIRRPTTTGPRTSWSTRPILDLYAGATRGRITVANELTRARRDRPRGAAASTAPLIASVPTAANAGYYAASSGSARSCGRLVEAAPGSSSSLRGDATPTTSWTGPRPRCSRHRPPNQRGLPLAVRDHAGRPATRSRPSQRARCPHRRPHGFSDLDTLTNGLHPGRW